MKMPSIKSLAMFFIGVVISLVALRFVPAELKAKIGL